MRRPSTVTVAGAILILFGLAIAALGALLVVFSPLGSQQSRLVLAGMVMFAAFAAFGVAQVVAGVRVRRLDSRWRGRGAVLALAGCAMAVWGAAEHLLGTDPDREVLDETYTLVRQGYDEAYLAMWAVVLAAYVFVAVVLIRGRRAFTAPPVAEGRQSWPRTGCGT